MATKQRKLKVGDILYWKNSAEFEFGYFIILKIIEEQTLIVYCFSGVDYGSTFPANLTSYWVQQSKII